MPKHKVHLIDHGCEQVSIVIIYQYITWSTLNDDTFFNLLWFSFSPTHNWRCFSYKISNRQTINFRGFYKKLHIFNKTFAIDSFLEPNKYWKNTKRLWNRKATENRYRNCRTFWKLCDFFCKRCKKNCTWKGKYLLRKLQKVSQWQCFQFSDFGFGELARIKSRNLFVKFIRCVGTVLADLHVRFCTGVCGCQLRFNFQTPTNFRF